VIAIKNIGGEFHHLTLVRGAVCLYAQGESSVLCPISSMEDAMIADVARSPYVLLSVSVLLGSAIYLLGLLIG
jgi:hypothetical protein